MPVCASPRRRHRAASELVCADIPSFNLRSSLYPYLNSLGAPSWSPLEPGEMCFVSAEVLNGLRFGTAVLLRFNKC